MTRSPDPQRPPRGEARAGLSDHVEEVRHATVIVDVIGQHVALKKAGRTFKGLCPFHAERTPSFHVDEAKGVYHCFGCGAGGDVFNFVMQQEGLSFPETVRVLAERAGIPLPSRQAADGADDARTRIFAVNEAAQQVFAAELLSSGRSTGAGKALEYLTRRGIDASVVESFGLGWAPDSWGFLRERLARRFSEDDLVASGLLVTSDRGGPPYDRFRGRVTFPIRSLSGRVVGFGGRIIDAGEPKYVNSPESAVYVKGRHLFGLDRARAAIRREGLAVLVEGYVDAISLHAHGVDCAVAVLGTAMTADQARLLARFTQRVVLSFDGDAAGLAATRRSIEVLLAEGVDASVVRLPAGVDPDDHVRQVGGEAYWQLVRSAPGTFDFLLESASRGKDLRTPAGRVGALNELLPFLAAVRDRVLRAELVDTACHSLGVQSELVHVEVGRALRQGAARPQLEVPRVARNLSPSERVLLTWMLSDDRVRQEVRGLVDEAALAELAAGNVVRAILEEPPGTSTLAGVVSRLDDEAERQLVRERAVDLHAEPVPEADLRESVAALLEASGISPRDVARRRKVQVDRLLEEATREKDLERVCRLQQEAFALGKAIQRAH